MTSACRIYISNLYFLAQIYLNLKICYVLVYLHNIRSVFYRLVPCCLMDSAKFMRLVTARMALSDDNFLVLCMFKLNIMFEVIH